jgi:hypothetical protein
MKDAESVHYLPLRIDISGNPAFDVLHSRVQRVISGALEYELPSDRMLELARETFRNENSSCLTVGCVVRKDDGAPAGKSPGAGANCSDLCDVDIQIDQARATSVQLEFDSSVLDENVARQLTQNFSESMRRGITNPSQRLSEISLALQAQLASAMQETEPQFSF